MTDEITKPKDDDYDNRKAFADRDDYYTAWAERSAAFRERVPVEMDIQYGDQPRNRLDIIPGDPDQPTLFHIHGGYWQWNDKEDYTCCAEAAHAAGLNAVLVEHTLAPEATLPEIVAEVRAGLGWYVEHKGDYGIRNPDVIVSGHSSGGHLASMCQGMPGVAGVMLISGIFDLRPIQQIYVNDVVGMDPATAEANSPILKTDSYPSFAIVAWGEDELVAFQAQGSEYVQHLEDTGNDADAVPAPGRHHFSVLDELVQPDGAVFRALARRLGVA